MKTYLPISVMAGAFAVGLIIGVLVSLKYGVPGFLDRNPTIEPESVFPENRSGIAELELYRVRPETLRWGPPPQIPRLSGRAVNGASGGLQDHDSLPTI